ncbi:MAG: hypothetical protein HY863_01270, partial [Chloroflexi bacterium]|nr:hypothetical protein [Chloroflexota bacterium]
MSHTDRIYLLVVALLIASIACAAPAISTPDTGSISTTIAQTVVAGLTQNAPLLLFSPTVEIITSTPSLTFTPEPPTFTPTETITPTLTLIPTLPFTATLEIPLISVSVPTNCRNGPGKVYNMVGALLIGQVAEVYGRNESNNYWYIRNPGAGDPFCWVWGEYATLIGPVMLLPVFTPPPTPTATSTPLPTKTPTPSPAFKAEYVSLDTCNNVWWAEITLKNTGSIPFKSINISVTDKVTDMVVVNLADGFTNIDGCLKTTTKDIIGIGDTYLISAPAFTYNPTGHNIHVEIT